MSKKKSTAVHIVLRPGPDWRTQTYQDLEKTREFCRNIGRPETLIIDRVRLWDKTFRIGFFEFRQMLKEISLKNFQSVRNADLVTMEEARTRLSPDAFYLFTDDDDWFHPEIAAALGRFDPRTCAALHWDSAIFSKGSENLKDSMNASNSYTKIDWDNIPVLAPGVTVLKDGMFWSNNYAVSGEYLLQRAQNMDIVCQHYRADGAFRARLTALHRRTGYKTLLRYLLYPGYRIRTLGNNPDGGALRALVRDVDDAYRSTHHPREFEWVKPYALQVSELCGRLLKEAAR
jgi:hypothetical protein